MAVKSKQNVYNPYEALIWLVNNQDKPHTLHSLKNVFGWASHSKVHRFLSYLKAQDVIRFKPAAQGGRFILFKSCVDWIKD